MTTAAPTPTAIHTPRKTHKVTKHHLTPTKSTTSSIPETLPAIDARIDALKSTGTPQLPYCLSIPGYCSQDDFLAIANHCAKHGNAPYCGHLGIWEHKTHYTFIPRQGENLLGTTPHPGFVPGSKGMLAQAQRKKLTLADYKKRQVDSPGASNGDEQEQTNGSDRAEGRSPAPLPPAPVLKRPAPAPIENDVSKKARLSPPREKAKFAPLPPKVSPLPPDPLPPILSPDLPPLPPLPRMLSPLPDFPEAEEELMALKEALVTPPRQTNTLQVPGSSGPRAPTISPMTAESTPKARPEKKKRVEAKSPSPEPPRRKSLVVTLKTPGRRSKSPVKKLAAGIEDGELADGSPKKLRTTPQADSRPRSQTSIPSTPAKPVSPRTAELIDSMKAEAARLSKDAVTLKRKMDKRTKGAAGSTLSTTDKILSVAEGVDSILCFALSFTYEDEIAHLQGSSASHRKQWRTLPAYLGYVEGCANPFREIYEALRQVGTIIRSLAHEDELHDVSQDPKRRPWLASYRDLKRAEADSMVFGQSSRMKEILPETWEARNEKGSGEKRARPGSLKGPFKLPFIIAASSSLEAVRFGVHALREWTALKKVHYDAVCKI